MELNLSLLSLAVESCVGHEHRIQPIVLRAATIFADRFGARYGTRDTMQQRHVSAVHTPSLNFDLDHMSDEQAAGQIADAWLEALAIHLKV